jgi:chemotaxis regulatin CheY-phosphate phosphatase CheZ
MSGSQSLTTTDDEFDRIELAMSESARGRWFLQEYARRNRSADTEMLLGAIHRLEGVVTSEREADHVDRMRGDIMDMAQAIARTKTEIAAISAGDPDHSRLDGASLALDAIVRATERATTDILGAAENVQEAAWLLREAGTDTEVCDELDRRATQIYTACSFQDLTAQRTARIVQTLRYLEERLAAMIAIWGDPAGVEAERSAHPIPEVDLSQSDVDRFIDMEPSQPVAKEEAGPKAIATLVVPHEDIVFLDTEQDADEPKPDEADVEDLKAETAVAAPKAEVSEDEPAEPIDIEAAFADIDGLTMEEKMALFS